MNTTIGHILEIDLSHQRWTTRPFPPELVRSVLGGRGANVWLLSRMLSTEATAVGPDNLLILSNGLFTGARLPTASRMHLNALSPQTKLLGSANVGGDFGAALRRCCIQTVVIRGHSIVPLTLLLEADGVRFCDASDLWGLDTWDAERRLAAAFPHKDAHFMLIGPAGEHGVGFGCIMTDHDHAAGRTGLGAVMGSKHLKAIGVLPPGRSAEPPVSAPLKTAMKRYIIQLRQAAEFGTVARYGGAGQVTWADDMGILPTRNFQETHFDRIADLDGTQLESEIVRNRGCRGCPVHCKAELRFRSGKYANLLLSRPEFESMLSFGPRCGVADVETVVYLDNLCGRMGMDSISTAAVIAFAIDLFERNILTPVDTEGLVLRWGDGDVIAELIEQIAYQRDFGKLLARGVRAAAATIGRDAEHFAPHVKGLEISTYHPTEIMGTALGYAVASRGGDFSHVHPSLEYRWSPDKAARYFGTPAAVDIHSIKGKGKLVRWAMCVNAVVDSLGICKVPALGLLEDFDLRREAEFTSAFLGETITVDDLIATGERIVTLERLFNLERGATAADDTLPAMFTDHARQPVPITPMVQDFYAVMGWDAEGRPTPDTLRRLAL